MPMGRFEGNFWGLWILMQSKRRKQSWKLTTSEFMFVHFMGDKQKSPNSSLISAIKIFSCSVKFADRDIFLRFVSSVNNRLLFLTRIFKCKQNTCTLHDP